MLDLIIIFYPFLISYIVWKIYYQKKFGISIMKKRRKPNIWEMMFFWPWLWNYENKNNYKNF